MFVYVVVQTVSVSRSADTGSNTWLLSLFRRRFIFLPRSRSLRRHGKGWWEGKERCVFFLYLFEWPLAETEQHILVAHNDAEEQGLRPLEGGMMK